MDQRGDGTQLVFNGVDRLVQAFPIGDVCAEIAGIDARGRQRVDGLGDGTIGRMLLICRLQCLWCGGGGSKRILKDGFFHRRFAVDVREPIRYLEWR